MNSKLLLIIVFLSSSFFAIAQTVGSKPYSLMLSTLLSSDVPIKSVSEITHLENFQVLDAREKNEFEISHLKNAIWVGYDDFNFGRIESLDKSKPTIVYCSVGYRSEKITEKLRDFGFGNVYNLYGGIFEWANEQKPVYKFETETDSVHAYDKIWGVWLNIDEKVYR